MPLVVTTVPIPVHSARFSRRPQSEYDSRNGRIALQQAGEFKAAGMTAADMEKELLKLCGSQLSRKRCQ